MKRIIGIIMCIIGIGLIGLSHYIGEKVDEGEGQISTVETSVSQGKKLFGLTPYTKAIGNKALINPAESKIQAGKEEIAFYKTVEKASNIAGIVLCIAGIGLIIISFFNKRKYD